MVVLVTGASGQLGQAIKFIEAGYPAITFYFFDSSECDITDKVAASELFKKTRPDFCINAAAYTAVDKAESESEKAYLINVKGARNLAEICKETSTVLLHVSTDFVFNGDHSIPYVETDVTDPIGTYGQTKREGELAIMEVLENHYIVRTSWLYSDFGNNFLKTMLRLGKERESLGIVNDQIGTPTHAVDLARALVFMIVSNKNDFGIYHFSNEGEATWFDFAKEIFRLYQLPATISPIPTSEYPTPAKRPFYSVLDKSKIKAVFGIEIPHWTVSLEKYRH